MFHRLSLWWRALLVVFVALATVTWPSASFASSTPQFLITAQTPNVSMASGPTATLHVSFVASPGSSVHLALYPALTSRSQIAQMLGGQDLGERPLTTTALVSTQCPTSAAHIFVTLVSIGATASSDCRHRTLQLPCARLACAGVYPLRYETSTSSGTTITWSMVAVRTSTIAHPIRVVLLTDVDPSASPAGTIAAMRALAAFPSAPLTIGANYRSLTSPPTTPFVTQWRRALRALVASPEHVGVVAPPIGIDFGNVAAVGHSAEVAQQLALANASFTAVTGRYGIGPVWLRGPVTQSDLAALARAGTTNVVVPGTSLSPDPSTTLVWGAPTHPTGVPATLMLASDGPLSALLGTTGIPPVQRALLAIDSLAFMHFIAPNAATPRTVPIVLTTAQTGAAFLHNFLRAFQNNPFVHLTSLSPSFSNNLVGSNGAPSSWNMAAATSAAWSTQNANTLTAVLAQLHSFTQGIASPAVANALVADVASAEQQGPSDQRQLALEAAQRIVTNNITQFHIDNSSVTLTSQGTALPITIVSRANYTMTVLVHVAANSLTFAKGATFAATLSSPTTALRVPLRHASGSDVTLQITLTTPDGLVTLAHSAIQVRIAGTSVVGYVLSFASLFVLAMWWWRTHRRSTTGKHSA